MQRTPPETVYNSQLISVLWKFLGILGFIGGQVELSRICENSIRAMNSAKFLLIFARIWTILRSGIFKLGGQPYVSMQHRDSDDRHIYSLLLLDP